MESKKQHEWPRREKWRDDPVYAVAPAAWYGEQYRPVVDDTPLSLLLQGAKH
ncbi:MAG: hypothetical protein AVDCRST_MAG93-3023 [uncultured Chloroflexia bacterium]|uniref:Uncharacterized protein n=1 Tax=uncultured Chloroflexia bacterium TaxID=1672391 RepID=A0A6J4JGG0_9CHLR|nr:MAG: hypothetical protein AVDCRST_MAG93-3023 [uncultured Chloroflexia bacterium]